jgi:UDP-N-acetylglucosamine acyltransferase
VINPHAVIHPSARIADNVTIGPWTIIGENVTIGEGCQIASHVVIEKNTQLGQHNKIFSHVVLGTDPQHTGYKGESTWLEIGDHNTIREFVTINRGTQATGITKMGSHNYMMSYSHIAHDCVVGSHVVFANSAMIAGHVEVGDHAILGAYAGVHQFVKIGEYCFLGRATKIFQDILPYMMVIGNPGAPLSLNSVGLRRHGFTRDDIVQLKEAFSILFRRGLKQIEILAELEQLAKQNHRVHVLLQAVKNSERGIARPSSSASVDLHVAS